VPSVGPGAATAKARCPARPSNSSHPRAARPELPLPDVPGKGGGNGRTPQRRAAWASQMLSAHALWKAVALMIFLAKAVCC